MIEKLFVEGEIPIAQLIKIPDSNNGLPKTDTDMVTTRLLGLDPVYKNLKEEYLHLVKRCFDSSPLSAREVSHWGKLDSLLSQRIQKMTGSRYTPAILPDFYA